MASTQSQQGADNMAKSKHPLDNEFNVVGTTFDDNFDDEVIIPEDPEEQNLELIIKLALQQYKSNADDMSLFDPKGRLKVMELNTALLNTAKDARYKLETLRMKVKPVAGKPAGAGPPEDSVGTSRSELAERVARMRIVK